MGRKTIGDEEVTQWIQARRKGESYRSIGRRLHVDPRTVKLWVQRAGEEREKEHWEAVSRQVDAKYFDQHYQMLLQIAAAVLDSVHTDPVFAQYDLDAPTLLNARVQSALEKSAHLLAGRGLDVSPAASKSPVQPGIKDQKAERLGSRLLLALMEHEPQLKSAIEAWERDWAKFQKARLSLVEASKSLLGYADIDDDLAEKLKMPVVQEALQREILGEEPCSSKVDDINEGKAHLIRSNTRSPKIVYTGPKHKVVAASNVYDKVLSQLSHKERVKPLQKSYSSLMNQVREVENYVDKFILVGRPQGQCNLCLNRSI